MIKSIIFDFDGLIIDTETAWYDVYKELLLERYAYELPIEVFAKTVGSSGDKFWHNLSAKLDINIDDKTLKIDGLIKHREKMKNISLRPGVLKYLKDAKEKKLNIALATSSSSEWVNGFMEQFDIKGYFDLITTKDHVTETKPSPELYMKTLQTLSISPDEAIVFEDSLNGLIAANRAGIKTVIVPNPVTRHLNFNNYFMKINSMDEKDLKEILYEINLDNQRNLIEG